RNEDGSYNGTFSVKIGPTSASYSGKLSVVAIDEATHTATMEAHGTDKRGQGGADATIVSTLSPLDDGGTRVEVSTDYRITGRLARFGRGGMIEDISEKLLRQFATALQASLSAEPPKGAKGTTEAAASAAASGTEPAAGTSSTPSTPPSTPPSPAQELSGLSLVGGVLADRIKRNPLPAVAVGLFALLLLLRANRGRAER